MCHVRVLTTIFCWTVMYTHLDYGRRSVHGNDNQKYFKTANLSDWDTEGLPEHFDAREKWPYCTSISRIFNQGNCISSYAVAVASAISDRICIGSNGLKKTTISSQHIITCCYLCGEGCEDGDHSEAWFFYQRHGVCSGGDRPNEGCQPYSISPCDHSLTNSKNSCKYMVNKRYTPTCWEGCSNPSYPFSHEKDNHRGIYYRVPVYGAMREIYERGPITTELYQHKNFKSYKSGIYHYNLIVGKYYIPKQTVKLIGWGETDDGTKYWLAANSFGTNWGENGFFKISRGTNECNVETRIYAGLPL